MAAKFRTDLTLVMALQALAILLARYGQAKDLAEDLKMVLGISLYADQQNSFSTFKKQNQRVLHSKERQRATNKLQVRP